MSIALSPAVSALAGAVLHAITTPEDLTTLRVEPTFAGSDYPFGAPVLAG